MRHRRTAAVNISTPPQQSQPTTASLTTNHHHKAAKQRNSKAANQYQQYRPWTAKGVSPDVSPASSLSTIHHHLNHKIAPVNSSVASLEDWQFCLYY